MTPISLFALAIAPASPVAAAGAPSLQTPPSSMSRLRRQARPAFSVTSSHHMPSTRKRHAARHHQGRAVAGHEGRPHAPLLRHNPARRSGRAHCRVAQRHGDRTPYLIHTRFLFENGTASNMTLVESVVIKPGDWAFNATGYLHYDGIESWPAISAEQRDTRSAIQAAGDVYFDRFDNASVVIPMASACARLEGVSYTARGNFSTNTCDGYPSTVLVTDRRYIVDEEYGAVDIIEGFPGLDRSVPKVAVPNSHLFRVENGKIRYIHTASHCIFCNCGLNTTTFGRR